LTNIFINPKIRVSCQTCGKEPSSDTVIDSDEAIKLNTNAIVILNESLEFTLMISDINGEIIRPKKIIITNIVIDVRIFDPASFRKRS
jgi:hypothetical protein